MPRNIATVSELSKKFNLQPHSVRHLLSRNNEGPSGVVDIPSTGSVKRLYDIERFAGFVSRYVPTSQASQNCGVPKGTVHSLAKSQRISAVDLIKPEGTTTMKVNLDDLKKMVQSGLVIRSGDRRKERDKMAADGYHPAGHLSKLFDTPEATIRHCADRHHIAYQFGRWCVYYRAADLAAAIGDGRLVTRQGRSTARKRALGLEA